ncbi:MAG: DUF2723 domain-containing protein [Gemmatimonadetes bacterium]|nr:DUF2723 domain-containing protein [Gemmatimonadota bacterium]
MSNDSQANSGSRVLSLTGTHGPPYGSALIVFFVVLVGYVWTLAPTVTFWDAGEFLAAAKILGVPHPPGTPGFVMMANVWGSFFPIGGFAYRVNFMTALFSAGAAALLFLVVHAALQRLGKNDPDAGDKVFVIGGAAAAAVMSAFVFTVWQNSNETEVYMFASFTIAAITWLAMLWRKNRGTARASHLLLVLVYLGAFSVGNHLLALLVGPALIGFMWHVITTEPLPNASDRRVEWAQWAVVLGIWALFIGSGLGSTTIMAFAALVFLGAAAFAISAGGAFFTVATLLIGVVGASTYIYLYIRAGLSPMINEADPSTWEAILAVIRREQYPPRLPTDNPLYASGAGNPGRTLQLIGLQIQNYLQYFDWQWSNGFATTNPVFAGIRLPFTMAFTSLGIFGVTVLYTKDRSTFWMLVLIFAITGPGLVGYMNFKPGFSLGWDIFRDANQHEVRERDYFFVISFQMWGVFAGIGVAGLYRFVREKLQAAYSRDGSRVPGALKVAPGVFAIALLPFVLNFSAASRAHGPDNTLALDFARNLLQTIEPYGIVFTNGDNDTFPLWYAQEVEGIRQDVAVVNLSLGNTNWYIKQLRDNPVRPFDPEQAPWFANRAPETVPPGLHTMSDAEIDALQAELLREPFEFRAGRIQHTLPANSPLYVKDVLMLRLILENVGVRPVYWSTTAGSGNWVGLSDYMVQEGLALKLYVDEPPDLSRLAPGLWVPVDLPRTDSLAWHIYDYARLFDVDSLDLDPTSDNIAGNLSLPFLVLGGAYQSLGDTARMIRNFERAYHLSPNPAILGLLESAGGAGATTDVPEVFPIELFDSLPTGEPPESLMPAMRDSTQQ